MKTTVERPEPTKVKLTVEVEPARVAKAYDKAAKAFAAQIQLPGFRKGKAPRRLIEQRVGADALRSQALEDSLTSYYVEAIRKEELDVVGQPEIDLKSFDEKEGCSFEATVDVRPEFELPDHTGIAVTFPEWDVDDSLIETQLEEMRERFSELEEVERPAQNGDYVTMDLVFSIDGEEITDGAVEDALYEIGSQGVTAKLDEELVGVEAGSEVVYTDALPDDYPEHGGQDAEFTVTVKDVRAKHLPDLDDDFAMTASEFDSIQELRADIRRNLLRRRVSQAQGELRGKLIEAYLAKLDVPLPEAMVENEAHERIHQVEHQAAQYGIELDDLYSMQDTTAEEFSEQAHEQARSAVKAQLVLDRLAQSLQVPVSAQDIDLEIYRHAQTNNADPEQIARTIQEQGSLPILVGDVMRRKAIDAIFEAADIEGGPDDDLMVELGLKPAPATEESTEVTGDDEGGEDAPAAETDEA